jgi:hypothetical protein
MNSKKLLFVGDFDLLPRKFMLVAGISTLSSSPIIGFIDCLKARMQIPQTSG